MQSKTEVIELIPLSDRDHGGPIDWNARSGKFTTE